MFTPNHLADYLIQAAKHYPTKTALVFGKREMTYQTLDKMTNQVANALMQQGLQRGDRVVVCLGNQIETAMLFWGVLKANGIVSIVNPALAKQKLTYILRDSGARFMFMQNDITLASELLDVTATLEKIIFTQPTHLSQEYLDFESLLSTSRDDAPVRQTIDLDLAAIVYTSGSTGVPKGVMLSHRNMLAASMSINQYLALRHEDVIISALPMSFDYGLYQMILSTLNGATCVVEIDFAWPIQFVKRLAEVRATVLPVVPTMLSILENHMPKVTYDFSSVRIVTNTGAMLLPQHIRVVKALFANALLFSMYGLTECKRCTYLPPKDIDTKPNSVGIAIPNTEIWIEDDLHNKLGPKQIGQLVIRGATVMQGYWNKPIETNKMLKPGKLPGEKILCTGDYGYLDEEGYFYFCGRKDDTIKRFGEKVSLKEIEEMIYSYPQCKLMEVAVIDIPNETLGSVIIAFVGNQLESTTSKDDVLAHCKKSLAKSHWPQDIYFMPELPRNVNGKFDKAALREYYYQQQF